jgi:predicted lipid-binding transport protein (Tim44 family)
MMAASTKLSIFCKSLSLGFFGAGGMSSLILSAGLESCLMGGGFSGIVVCFLIVTSLIGTGVSEDEALFLRAGVRFPEITGATTGSRDSSTEGSESDSRR